VGEPVGDLPLPANLHLTPCRRRATNDQDPSQALQQRRADAVLQLGLRLLECYTLLPSRYRAQAPLGQRRLKPNWYKYESGKRNEDREPKQRPYDS